MTRPLLAVLICLSLAACAAPSDETVARFAAEGAETGYNPPLHPNETEELRRLINRYADRYEVPRALVHRVVIRESTHRPWARNGPYYGLMQILPATARSMGFQGQATDLLDAETNLRYSVKYLRGAWLLSDGSFDTAVKWYSRGYYYEAKRQGMLVETGLRPG
ncbi:MULTISPECIES: lytic transglycosylase domain-containing protein [unclassified Roseivivax]|uniref:lytic transglycosylase domain-containing protein n=1 Tax=Roseivivax sp. GX 12232 TaxID=2900547 RepID=UPI001E3F463B|nr:lytic transglycosylase domain-containing protein [Roseivivax sp. GX 12232]MCE0506039.1 lytic transglycosylase domain-containing protein [Roseivivax sp. GX 12232]